MTHVDMEIHCLLEGDVQGVGLRYWICKEASSKRWKGFVRNLASGHVELVVQEPVTEEEVLKQLVYHERNPAQIESITVTKRPVKEIYDPFQVLR